MWFPLILLLLTACSRGPEPLRIYSSIDAKETREFVQAYTAATGEKIEFVRLSTGEALTRIRSESKNPQVTVWIGGGSNEHVIAGNDHLLEPYRPKTDFEPPPETHGRDGEWNGWYMGVIGFGTNTEFLKKNGIEAPTSYKDLLKPIFTGKIGTSYAYTSGTAYTILASLISLMGEEKGFDFIEKLNRQIHHYNKSGSACVTQAGLGEIAVCIAFSHDIMHKGTAQGYPIKITFPSEGAGFEVGGASLIRGGPDLEKGKKFIDWLLSLEVQNKLADWNHIPVHPKARLSDQAAAARLVKRVPVDIYESAEQHEKLLTTWRTVTGQ